MRVIEVTREFTQCVSVKLGDIIAILHGSYARGDFNEWSDIDVLIISKKPLPQNPLRRLDLIDACLTKTPRIEPVIVTLEEFKILLKEIIH